MPDDVGYWNVSAYHNGMMGGTTPNIDRIAEEEFVEHALDFIDRSVKSDKPFFLWFNPTRMHVWTHLSEK